MWHSEGRDSAMTEIDSQCAVMNATAAISTPVPETCSDWRRETEGTGAQSFYWCESPLDVSVGGSDNY